MRIERLRLAGFKSFVEPVELLIEPGLTGIVGPNGCGKSNLTEALRWVMGEGSAKSLRGGGMDDVIFAGTDRRPARDFAEVTLSGDSEGARIPGTDDVGALEVVRRIERGAGSAYRLNGRDVRARDVALLFADAATGAHSPAMVGQGRVAAIVNAKPAERRALLEEAAGIAGLHVRRREAEIKLRATAANLDRVREVAGDLDRRAQALRRQARAAERYRTLSNAIRQAEAVMLYARWRDAAVEADATQATARDAEARVTETQATLEAAVAAQGEAAGDSAAARDRLATLRAEEQGHALALTRLRSEREALARQLDALTAEAGRIAAERAAEDALTQEAASALARLDPAIAQEERALADHRTALAPAQAAVQTSVEAQRAAELRLAEARAAAAQIDADQRIADAAIAAARTEHDRIARERASLADTLAALPDPARVAVEARAARDALAVAQRDAADREAAVQQADASADAAAIVHAEAAQAEAAIRATLAALAAEAQTLAQADRNPARAAPAISAALRVDAGYERALAAALGSDLDAPAAAGEGDGWHGAAPQPGDPALPPGATPLANHVRGAEALARRLTQIGLVERHDDTPLAPGQMLVTRDGHVRRWDGLVRGAGSAAAATAAALQRARRRDELGGEVERVRRDRDAARQTLGETRASEQAAQDARRLARAAMAGAGDTLRAAQRALDRAEGEAERADARRRDDAARLDALTQRAAQAEAALAEAEQARAALAPADDARAALGDAERAAEAARGDAARARDALTAVEREGAAARERLATAKAERSGWQSRAGEAARRLAAAAARSSAIADERAQLAERPIALDTAIAQAEGAGGTTAAALAEAIAAERDAAARLAAADRAREQAGEAMSAAREARAGAVARAEAAEARRIETSRIAGERFQAPPPLLPTKFAFEEARVGTAAEASAAHDRLLGERERLGPVNLIAAAELEEVVAEHARLVSEVDELDTAVAKLRGSIGHLNREGRARLLSAFEEVDRHFRALFARLFEGGAAHLALTESDDPLEAGLEIMAQPPGKKLASLSLLSGGEQALTALALVFALFLTAPAPICVLDEVDAPLDDANVERFCDLLDAMSAETATRYLIVTHNAVTMSRMHRLFGITMIERGVSRLVSVDLQTAESYAAA